MTETITELVEGAVGSPWIYLALCAFAALDAFLPMVPSESLVIGAGVFAATGSEPNLVGIVIAAAAGAFAGDPISYAIGSRAGARALRHADPRSRKRLAIERGARVLRARGGAMLIGCRYLPGARTAMTLTAGAAAYPRRSFALFDGIGAASWALYATLLGYLGGEAFEDDPLLGLAVGVVLALAVAGAVELIRHVARARRRGRLAA